MHSCCRSTSKKRDRCNSPSEEGDRSPAHSSSWLWWWWTIRVIVVFTLKAGWWLPPLSPSLSQDAKPVSKTLVIRTSGQQKSQWADKNLIYDHDQLALIWFKEGWRCLGLGVWHCSSLGYEWEEWMKSECNLPLKGMLNDSLWFNICICITYMLSKVISRMHHYRTTTLHNVHFG